MKKELKQLEEALTQIQKYQMDEPDHEGEMAKSQMLKTMKYAADIMNMIDDTTNLPAWVQSKLTKIADYIGAVKHYMESKTVRHVVTNMAEHRESEGIRLVDMVPVNSRRNLNEVISKGEQSKVAKALEKIVGKPFYVELNYHTRNYEFFPTNSENMVIVGSGEDVGENTKYAWSIVSDGGKQYADGLGDNFGKVLSDILKSVQKNKRLF